jgi:superfamily II DNA/RNA helicase
MRENVKLAGYDVPTPIQQYVLPAIFKGHDVVACAQTGLWLVFFHISIVLMRCVF